MLTRALQNLEAKEAADISAKFAQIEFKYGDAERGNKLYIFDHSAVASLSQNFVGLSLTKTNMMIFLIFNAMDGRMQIFF